MFGQMTYFDNSGKDPIPNLWNLNDPKTFQDKVSRSEIDTIPDKPENDKKTKKPKRKKSRNIHNDNDDNSMNDEEYEYEDDKDSEDDVESVDGIKVHSDTLRLLSNNGSLEDDKANDADMLLSSPELHAMLEKPASGYIKTKTKRKNLMKSALMKQLKTFSLDEIPKESPFR